MEELKSACNLLDHIFTRLKIGVNPATFKACGNSPAKNEQLMTAARGAATLYLSSCLKRRVFKRLKATLFKQQHLYQQSIKTSKMVSPK